MHHTDRLEEKQQAAGHSGTSGLIKDSQCHAKFVAVEGKLTGACPGLCHCASPHAQHIGTQDIVAASVSVIWEHTGSQDVSAVGRESLPLLSSGLQS